MNSRRFDASPHSTLVDNSSGVRAFSRRNLLRAAGVGAAALALPGCQSETGSNRRAGAVAFEGWDFQSTLVQKNIREFMRRRPDIDVAYTPITSSQYVQKVVTEFTAGNEPDALYVYDDSLSTWAGAGYLQPLDGLPGVDEIYDALYPAPAKTMTLNGKRYGLPYYTDVTTLTFNAELAAKAGVNGHPRSLDELEHQAKKIKDAGLLKYPIGVPAQLSDTWWAWIWALLLANGEPMFDEQLRPTMDRAGSRVPDVFEWLHRVANKSKVLDPASLQMLPVPLDTAFKAGQYAFLIGARYALRSYNDEAESAVAGKAELAFLPSFDGPPEAVASTTRMYCLSARTKLREKAYALIRYLGGFDRSGVAHTAKFWFREQGLGFAFRQLADDPDIKKGIAEWANPRIYRELDELARPRTVLSAPWYIEFETELQKAVQEVVTGASSPSAATRSLANAVATLKRQYR